MSASLNIQTDDEVSVEARLSTNFTVLRVKPRHPPAQQRWARSSPTARSRSTGDGANQVYGVDGGVLVLRQREPRLLRGAKTQTPGTLSRPGPQLSGPPFAYTGDLLRVPGGRAPGGGATTSSPRSASSAATTSAAPTADATATAPRPRSIDGHPPVHASRRSLRLHRQSPPRGRSRRDRRRVGFNTEFENSDRIGISVDVQGNYERLAPAVRDRPRAW